jgi:hypothetical protein
MPPADSPSAVAPLWRVAEELALLDVEAWPVERCLRWLAEQLQRAAQLSGVRMQFRHTGSSGPPVRVDLPSAAPGQAVLDPHEQLAQKPQANTGQQVPHVLLEGPAPHLDSLLLPQTRCLLFRVPVEGGTVALGLIGGTGACEHAADWVDAVASVVRLALWRRAGGRLEGARSRRQQFYEQLATLERHPENPDAEFQRICRFWHQLSGAEICWLWLYNPITETFELTGYHAAGKQDLPNDRLCPGRTSAAAFTHAVKRPERITDIAGWRRQHEGVRYEVECSEELLQMGLGVLHLIPLLAPGSKAEGRTEPAALSSPGRNGPIIGVLALLSRDPNWWLTQPESSLMLMGRLTAQAVQNLHVAQQRNVLVALNHMAQRHLTRTGRPAEIRREYLEDLIQLIRRELHVDAVSIFYRRPFGEEVECLASTGLMHVEGKSQPYPVVPREEHNRVVYRRMEARTGRCYATGETLLLIDHAEISKSPGKYCELTTDWDPHDPKKPPRRAFPCVIHPIPAGHDAQAPGGPAVGVIRCAGHMTALFPGQFRSINPVELETLRFIAHQIAPILQILESQVQREQTISIVKHDLESPLNLMRDLAHKISDQLRNNEPVRIYDLQNLEVAHMLASNLVAQLDPDPTGFRSFRPSQTFLEGDLVARIKNMLGHYAEATRGMRIRFDGFRQVPPLYVDRNLIERVLLNLLLNAIKYGTERSLIEVTARAGPEGYALDVANYGLGIEEDERRHLFQPNYRSPRAKRRAMGLGLGLYISRKAMELHGGRLEVTRLKNPTIFTLFLPKRLESSPGSL